MCHFISIYSQGKALSFSLLVLQRSVRVVVSTEAGVWLQIDVRARMALLDPSVKEVSLKSELVPRRSGG